MMPIVSSTYWNMVHGLTPEDVMQDKEGLQTMRNIGKIWHGCYNASHAPNNIIFRNLNLMLHTQPISFTKSNHEKSSALTNTMQRILYS